MERIADKLWPQDSKIHAGVSGRKDYIYISFSYFPLRRGCTRLSNFDKGVKGMLKGHLLQNCLLRLLGGTIDSDYKHITRISISHWPTGKYWSKRRNLGWVECSKAASIETFAKVACGTSDRVCTCTYTENKNLHQHQRNFRLIWPKYAWNGPSKKMSLANYRASTLLDPPSYFVGRFNLVPYYPKL